MGMRETPRSLQAYFIIVGVISIALNVKALTEVTGALMASAALGIAVGLAFLVAGLRVKTSLAAGARDILIILLVNGGLLVLGAAATLTQPGQGGAQLVAPIVGLAITAYLYVNVKRLAKEAQGSRR
jgi:hypothetical protein